MSLMISSTLSPRHSSSTSNQPHISYPYLEKISTRLHYAYPIVLILFFLGAVTVRGIRSSSYEHQSSSTQHGPGGKPLPPRHKPRTSSKDNSLLLTRNQSLLFEWLAAAVCFTFLCDAANVIVHALYDRHEQWWCGQATVVSIFTIYSYRSFAESDQ